MVEVTIYFHHGGEWLTSPELHYDRGCVTYWKGYDPDLISFIDLVNEYINKLDFVDCGLSVDVIDIVMYDGSFLLSPIVNEDTDCSESEDDSNNGMVFSCSDYDTDELENFVTKKKRNINDSLQYYKDIVKGMAFKDIAEAKQFCKLYALAKKVELVLVKSDKKRLRYTCAADDCSFLLLISGDLTTPGGLLEAVRTVLLEAYQRYCARHIEANWCKRWGKMCKNQDVDYNFTESFNAWIHKARYKPIIGMLEDNRVKIIERLAAKVVAVRKWKDDEFSPKSELLFIEYLKISKVCKMSGNRDNGYEATECTNIHIVNLREKKCTCRTWDLTGIPCPHAIKAMKHKKMIPKKEIHWYYSKEAALAVYKHKLQPIRGEPFWKYDPLHAIEPPELFKLVGRPKLMREREKDEVVKRQRVWKQTRKGKVMTCSNCGEQNHNARGCEKAKQGKQPTKKQGKQPVKQGKESGRGKKKQLRKGLVDKDEASKEDVNCTAPQPTQESQFEYASSSSYFPVAEDDDEDLRLRPRTISEEAFLTRLRKKQNP
ncbi:hypothetical protein RDI58_019457 [Solanum bulbocastanum]|uniref:SWIM-type domain-containing protein n=1 Tax=Solanum bulbocastanum TaxID=147425 RepID=A0AAN8Y7K5_SOLBU